MNMKTSTTHTQTSTVSTTSLSTVQIACGLFVIHVIFGLLLYAFYRSYTPTTDRPWNIWFVPTTLYVIAMITFLMKSRNVDSNNSTVETSNEASSAIQTTNAQNAKEIDVESENSSVVAQQNERTRPLATEEFIGYLIILAIPFVNLVVGLIWAFSSKGNINRRNFARAYLVFSVVAGFILFFVIMAMASGARR